MDEERLGVVGIVIEDGKRASDVNHILSQYGEIIIGRMGVPRILHKERGVSVISLIVHGTNDEIGAMTGRLGNLNGVQRISALSSR